MATSTREFDQTFVGHAVASEFDASVLMALNVSESLLACKGFNGPDILSRHLFLYQTKKAEVGDTTKFIHDHLIQNQLKAKVTSGKPLTAADFLLDQATIDQVVKMADEKLNGRTAGCGPAQRSYPLALCEYVKDDDLYRVSLQEAQLTHFSPIAGQVAGIVNVTIRQMMRGKSWSDAVAHAFTMPNLHEDVIQVSFGFHRRPNLTNNPQPGYAPAALNAALYYTNRAANAGEAIATAQANDKNFSVSLVGVLAGARWGLEKSLYENMIKGSQLPTLRTAGNNLAAIWKSKTSDVKG